MTLKTIGSLEFNWTRHIPTIKTRSRRHRLHLLRLNSNRPTTKSIPTSTTTTLVLENEKFARFLGFGVGGKETDKPSGGMSLRALA